MGQRGDDHGLRQVLIDGLDAGQIVNALNVHSTGTANALSARAPEGKAGIVLVLDLDESVEVHRIALGQVDVV